MHNLPVIANSDIIAWILCDAGNPLRSKKQLYKLYIEKTFWEITAST